MIENNSKPFGKIMVVALIAGSGIMKGLLFFFMINEVESLLPKVFSPPLQNV